MLMRTTSASITAKKLRKDWGQKRNFSRWKKFTACLYADSNDPLEK